MTARSYFEMERPGAVVQRRYRTEVVAGPSTGLALPLEGTVLAGSSPQAQLSEGKEGRLRRDLFFRLAVLPVRLPSLRERRRHSPFGSVFFERAGTPGV